LIGNLLRNLEQALCWCHTVLSKTSSNAPSLEVLATVVAAPNAIVALSTHHPPARHDPIADREPLHTLPQRHDSARPLVTRNVRRRAERFAQTSISSQIAGADATGMNAYQHLIIG